MNAKRKEAKGTPQGVIDSLLAGQELEFSFLEGLLGFASHRRFGLKRYQPADGSVAPFFLLESKEDEVCFPLIAPHLLWPDYRLTPSSEVLAKLGCGSSSELTVLAIVTLRERVEETTANLQGPLLLNPISRLGLQLVVEGYPVRYPLVKASSF